MRVVRRGDEWDGAQRHVGVCAPESRPLAGSSKAVAAAEGRRNPGIERHDCGAAARRAQSHEPTSDSGAPDGASASFRRFSRFVAQETLPGRAALTRRETVRTAVVLLLLLVSILFAAIGVQPASVEPIPAPASDAIGNMKGLSASVASGPTFGPDSRLQLAQSRVMTR